LCESGIGDESIPIPADPETLREFAALLVTAADEQVMAAALRKWSAWLSEYDHDPGSDLTSGISQPQTSEPVARPIDDVTVDRLLALKLSPRPHAYGRLALYQALRVHESAKIRAEEFDPDAGWLMVNGNGRLRQSIPNPPESASLAQACRDRLLVPQSRGWRHRRPRQKHRVSTTITGALRRAGSNATAHRRDTAATRMQRR